jgi:hypothetical protein
MAIADQPLQLDLGEDGPTVWLEAVPSIVRETSSAMTPSTQGQRVHKITTKAMAEAIKGVARSLHKDLAADGPDRISLGFAISVDTSGRVLIGAQGTVKVQLEWRKDSES